MTTQKVEPNETTEPQVEVLPRRGRHGGGGSPLPTTFRALRHRDYRLLWFGQIGNSASVWMEQVVRPLLMLELTGSALLVGLVIAARTFPQLFFGVFAGVVADRFDRKRVLIYSQIIAMAMQFVLAMLIFTGLIQVWHIFVTAVIVGAANAFKQPARQSLIPQLVPPEDLLNALALNSAAGNIMRVAGAGLAGVLLIFLGFGEVYLLDAFIYVGIIYTTVRMRVPSQAWAKGGKRVSFIQDLFDGFRYMRSDRKTMYLIITALVLFVFGQPYQQVFVPLFAIDVLGIDRQGVGLMLAITGVGALVGSLTVASKGKLAHRGLIMLGALAIFSVALFILAQSRWLPLSLGALLLAGAMTTAYLSLNNSLLLGETPPEYHGRIISFMNLDRGLISLGAVLSGALAQFLGPQLGLTIMAGICLALTALAFVAMPSVRRIS